MWRCLGVNILRSLSALGAFGQVSVPEEQGKSVINLDIPEPFRIQMDANQM